MTSDERYRRQRDIVPPERSAVPFWQGKKVPHSLDGTLDGDMGVGS